MSDLVIVRLARELLFYRPLAAMLCTPRVVILLDPSRSFDRGLLRGIARYVDTHRPWEFVRPPPSISDSPGWSARPYRNPTEPSRRDHYQRRPGAAGNHVAARSPDCRAGGSRVSRGRSSLVRLSPIGKLAAEHLAGLGLRQFAFAGFDEAIWSLERQRAFCLRLVQLGHAVKSFLVPLTFSRNQQAHWQKQLVRWLKSLPKPIGIMACNDDCAVDCRTVPSKRNPAAGRGGADRGGQ